MDLFKLKELNDVAKQIDKWEEHLATIEAIESESTFREELSVYELIEVLKAVDLLQETKLRVQRQTNQLKARFAKM